MIEGPGDIGFQASVRPARSQQLVEGMAWIARFLNEKHCLLEAAHHVDAFNGEEGCACDGPSWQ